MKNLKWLFFLIAASFITPSITGQNTDNEVSYTLKKVTATKVKTFNPNRDASPFHTTITHIEAPNPDGEGYKAELEKWKKLLAKKYPRKPENYKEHKRSSEPDPVSLQKIIPEQGFSNKSPIPGGTPSDNTLAVSDDGYLITSWNSEIYAYDLNADTAMFRPGGFRPAITFADFAPNPLFAPFDPKLLYDPTNERFVLVFLSGRTPNDSKIIVGFSSSTNPTDDWYVYELDGAPVDQNTWTDYPAIAMTENELFLTVNLVIVNEPWETGFDQTLIWQMNLQDGYSGAATLSSNMWQDVQFNGRNLRYMCPAQHGEGPIGDKMYFVSNRNYPQITDSIVLTNDSIFLITLTGEMDQNPTLDVKHLKSPIPYITPPNAKQKNGHTFNTNDGRVLGGIILENTLQFVASTRDTNTGFPIIYHGFIDDINGASPTMRANLISHPFLELGYPNLAFAGNQFQPQDVLIGFDHTADTVNSGYSIVYYNGNTDAYSKINRIMNGDGYVDMIGGTSERWGDYFGIQRAYNEPGKVWTCGYWGQANNQNAMSVDEIVTYNYVFASVDEEAKQKPNVTLYPNPVAKENPFVTLTFEVETLNKIEVVITTLNGQVVQKLFQDAAKAGKNQISFTTEGLASGQYIVSVFNRAKQLASKSFVVR